MRWFKCDGKIKMHRIYGFKITIICHSKSFLKESGKLVHLLYEIDLQDIKLFVLLLVCY